ncbi:Putative amidotransferase [Micromonospora haikouensis]|uniref:Putative amidotransferase n=2 Tax=Micromonospora haikouensis TaxID=686309 RepID=A0A1C4Y024_9ACTN|nr:Putative amidotransferase [Micromonospora haikouensis]
MYDGIEEQDFVGPYEVLTIARNAARAPLSIEYVTADLRVRSLPAAAPWRPGLVVAVCTGALLLGAAGLTHGRPCVTHQMVKDQLAAFVSSPRPGVVDDDRQPAGRLPVPTGAIPGGGTGGGTGVACPACDPQLPPRAHWSAGTSNSRSSTS